MRTLARIALALALFTASAAADTIKNFTLDSDLSGGYAAQGLVTIDVTNGDVQTSYFTLSKGSAVDATFTTPDYTQPLINVTLTQFTDAKTGYTFELIVPNASLVGYTGGSLCTSSHNCLLTSSGAYLPTGGEVLASDGSLAVAPATTAEPASLFLLGTGVVLTLALVRRCAAEKRSSEAAMI